MLSYPLTDMTEPEFDAFLQAREERWELLDGAPIMMIRTTQRHQDIVANILAALHEPLRGTGCRPTCSRTGVRTGAGTIRVPDLIVDCGSGDDEGMCATTPALVIEVLSPSRDHFDTHLWVSVYKTHRDITCIILTDPDAARAILHRREDAGWRPLPLAGNKPRVTGCLKRAGPRSAGMASPSSTGSKNLAIS